MPGLPIFGNTFAFINKDEMPVEWFRLAAQKQADVSSEVEDKVF